MSQSNENPYRAPQIAAEGESAPGFPVLRLTISGMLLALGIVLLLLMNGQPFENDIAFLLLAVVSGLLWIPLAVSPRYAHASFARRTVAVHAAIVVAILLGLPAAYERQQRFKADIQKLRARQGEFINKR